MNWRPLGESEEKPLKNEMLWTKLANEALEPEGQTILHCRYVSKDKYKNGGWVNIYKSTFLLNPDTKDFLSLVKAMDIPVSPGRHFFKEPGQLKQFTLLFPYVPKHWKRFHLVELVKGGDGFRVQDIERNASGVYQIELS